MIDPPDLEGTFHLFATGGRESAAGSRIYRPHHAVHENYLTSGLHEYVDRELLEPGQSAPVRVRLVSPEAYPRCLWEGRELSVQEGDRVVGRLTVTRILNPSLIVDPAKYSPVWKPPAGLGEGLSSRGDG